MFSFSNIFSHKVGSNPEKKVADWTGSQLLWRAPPLSFLPLNIVRLDHVELHHVLIVRLRLLHLVLEQVVSRTELGPLHNPRS